MKFLTPFENIRNARKNSEQEKAPPLWLMRQAGRYLPEYMKIRENYPQFLDFCFTPEAATEVTLQPIERFDFDAAILFSDILVTPYALGQKVWFEKGHGPRLGELTLEFESLDSAMATLDPVFQAIRMIRAQLPADKALIGFCGAPWTVATYMIQGKGSKDFAEAKAYAYTNPQKFSALLEVLTELSAEYLVAQIEAGVNAVQIFDSWAGAVPAQSYDAWVVEPTRKIVEAVKVRCPGVPVIGFPKGSGAHYPHYARETGVDGLGLDSSVDVTWAAQNIPENVVLQGNLDPMVLVAGGEVLDQQVGEIKKAMGARPYIFNLGHGIVPSTPTSHVERLVKVVRGEE